MTRFVIGLLLGLILGIAGSAAFLITAQGGDYLIGTSPRVRELEADLREGQREREWLRERLGESTQLLERMESRFTTLAERFDALSVQARPSPAHPAPMPQLKPGLNAAPRPMPQAVPAPAASVPDARAPSEPGPGAAAP